jgi:hypothetical protein
MKVLRSYCAIQSFGNLFQSCNAEMDLIEFTGLDTVMFSSFFLKQNKANLQSGLLCETFTLCVLAFISVALIGGGEFD